ncbi:MAG: glycosyltransferase family 9 protein [Acidobacteriota bacterium]
MTPQSTTPPDWSLTGSALLIRLRSIGDTALMTPCLAAIKDWRADIKISVLSEPLSAPLLEDHPLVDELIVVNASLASRARIIRRLRRERFDIAFNLHGGTTGTVIARLAGARQQVAFAGHRWTRLLSHRAPSPDAILGRSRIHSVEQQLALLHWSGVPWPDNPRLNLFVSPEAEEKARGRLTQTGLRDEPFAIIAPSAAMESKRWTAAGFSSIADHLRERWNLRIVVIAGPGQEAIANEVSEKAQGCPPVIAHLDLKELMAVIKMSRLFVGNDSGPAHIAAAFNRPMVIIFGSSNPAVWHPWTDAPHRVVHAKDAIEMIPSSNVAAAVDEVLSVEQASKKG